MVVRGGVCHSATRVPSGVAVDPLRRCRYRPSTLLPTARSVKAFKAFHERGEIGLLLSRTFERFEDFSGNKLSAPDPLRAVR